MELREPIERAHIRIEFTEHYIFELWIPLYIASIVTLWVMMLFIPLVSIFTIPVSLGMVYAFGMGKISLVSHPYIYKVPTSNESESE